jgi:hypothetical protein
MRIFPDSYIKKLTGVFGTEAKIVEVSYCC